MLFADFSFVLLCTMDEEIPLACTTALSLRKEGTSASIVCLVALPTELTSQRRSEQVTSGQYYFKKSVVCLSVAWAWDDQGYTHTYPVMYAR